MRWYWLILGTLAVWRVAHLFYGEDGPGEVFVRLRRGAGEGFWSTLLDCFYCLSLWVALPIALWIGESWKERALLWLAMSAGAILLERVTNRETIQPHVLPGDAAEENEDVLRGRTLADEDDPRGGHVTQWTSEE